MYAGQCFSFDNHHTWQLFSFIKSTFFGNKLMDHLNNTNIRPNEIHRDLILNVTRPYLIKSCPLQWHCFNINIKEWCNEFNNDPAYSAGISFEYASKLHNQYPQWERYRKSIVLQTDEFLKKITTNEQEWFSYGYKNLHDLPLKCSEGVDFGPLGFGELQDISFWLGSAGAHTSCHYDTYGCNIVVQVYGRYVEL